MHLNAYEFVTMVQHHWQGTTRACDWNMWMAQANTPIDSQAEHNVMCDFNVAADWYILIVAVKWPVSLYAHVNHDKQTLYPSATPSFFL